MGWRERPFLCLLSLVSPDSLYPLTSLPESHLYHNSFQKERGTFAITKKDLIRTMLLK